MFFTAQFLQYKAEVSQVSGEQRLFMCAKHNIAWLPDIWTRPQPVEHQSPRQSSHSGYNRAVMLFTYKSTPPHKTGSKTWNKNRGIEAYILGDTTVHNLVFDQIYYSLSVCFIATWQCLSSHQSSMLIEYLITHGKYMNAKITY